MPALLGEHYCESHQGNHSHYDPSNCRVCKLEKEVQELQEKLRETLISYNEHLKTDLKVNSLIRKYLGR